MEKEINDNRFYDLNAIKEAIDLIVEGKSEEVIKILKDDFKHIHFPLYITGPCEYKHTDKECEVKNEVD